MRRTGIADTEILRTFPTLRPMDLVEAWAHADQHREIIERKFAKTKKIKHGQPSAAVNSFLPIRSRPRHARPMRAGRAGGSLERQGRSLSVQPGGVSYAVLYGRISRARAGG